MPFQFYCPQGHLLEGHESQMGTPGQCPMCGAPFTFPVVGGAAPAAMPPSMPAAGGFVAPNPFAAPQQPGFGGAPGGFGSPSAFPGAAPSPGGFGQDAGHGFAAPPAPAAEVRILKILCPKGHEIPTPEDLLGTESLCPYCNAKVELLYENTTEYKRQQALQARQKEEATGRFWLRLAILAVVGVLGGFGFIVWLLFFQ